MEIQDIKEMEFVQREPTKKEIKKNFSQKLGDNVKLLVALLIIAVLVFSGIAIYFTVFV